ncbi:MAG: GNAT family N-acetyltransferase [Clostridiaceae bacterium]|nr:GNAT family N-acetyltransferase [Clostridiaceae bacterium]MBW4858542.1 GNAT family N-acetyltransferase [Clostridiaceae bacterium]MBW4867790.1 GNAT family N-acetyltransferase [Clostridiaceae bacterium]MBW4868020.1 GNAT family N-acetyltransferase [Clostridiaceae bacterium]
MEDYVLKSLSEDYAKEICSWKYEGEYSIYNFSDWDVVVKNKWGLLIKEKRELEFIAILLNSELVAYGRISEKEDKAVIGIGLKPSFCGKGYGKDIVKLLVQECIRRFPKYPITLEVRSFNKRAINCYKSIGFEIKDKYMENTFDGAVDEFYYMEYD